MRYSDKFVLRMFAFFFLCVITVGGCRSEDNAQPKPPMGNEVRSNLARDTNPLMSDADLAVVVAGNTDFALKAFGRISTNADTNTVFSPYSITLAVGLAAAGAKGTTLSGMEQALSFPLPQERLNPAFNKLDLLLASKTTGADFSSIDGLRDLYISGVVHQAFISVDEKGTEAAAATAISVGVTSVPPPPLSLTIDHPFLFLLRDRQTGLVLFMGKVVSL